MASKQIYVYENWSSDLPVFMGFLNIDNLRGKETCSFEYHSEWLKNNAARSFLDPDLQLYQGRQYAPMDKSLFGIFSDSCPDRWGRLLMRRREAIDAAPFFGLTTDSAAKEAAAIVQTVGSMWHTVAEYYGISRNAQEAMAPAFSLCRQ